MPEPLEGMTVVEMTIAVQGPAAALYLRDMGADVIKVEPPIGDPSRYGRNRQNETPDGTLGPQFAAVNRGKRSVCIDMNTDQGRQVLEALLENADIFLTNYRESALIKMGLGYDDLHERYPSLIYASVNGFGPNGEDADKAMLDGVAASRGGLVHHTGYADREPSLPGAIIIDTAGAMQLALGVMTAVVARERYGTGQRVQTSALGTTLWLQQWELTHTAMTGAELERTGNHHPNIRGFYGVYSTADGGAIMLAHVMDQDAWDALCIFADMPEYAFDPRFMTPGQRLGEGITEEDANEVRDRLKSGFAAIPMAAWSEFLYTQPEIIWEKVRSWTDVLEDPQNHANNYLTSINIDGVGESLTVGTLVSLSDTPGGPKGDPPALGEGNDDVLASAGVDAATRDEVTRHVESVREAQLAELLALVEENQ